MIFLRKLIRNLGFWALAAALGMGRSLWAIESSERIPSESPSFNFNLPSPEVAPTTSQFLDQDLEKNPDFQNQVLRPEIHFPSEAFTQKAAKVSSPKRQTQSARISGVSLPYVVSADHSLLNLQDTPSSKSQIADSPKVNGNALFDGQAQTWKYDSEGALWLSGKKARLMGEGSFGRVFEHPNNSDWVVKIIHGSRIYGNVAFYEHPEFQNLEKLSKLGLAPHPVDTRLIQGIPYIVSERVHGETLEAKIRQKEFGIQDLKLLREMLNQFLNSHFSIMDLTPSNVMVGYTASNPEPQAYIIDAGLLAARSLFASPFVDIEDLIQDCNKLLNAAGAKYQLALARREEDNKISLFLSK